MKTNLLFCLTFFGTLCFPTVAMHAQREAKVTGKFTLEVGDNDNITLRDAKHKCVENAKIEAVKAEFGEMVTSDIIETNVQDDGQQTSSFFMESTQSSAKGDWLGDTKEPEIAVEYQDGKLLFTAEVWGVAREIIQSKIDLKCNIMRDGNGKKVRTDAFASGERIYLDFRAPSSGYVAIYLLDGNDEASCLLPYPRAQVGRFEVIGGRDYLFFDKESDPQAVYYKMTTKREVEDNNIVVIFSPNPFTKCNDITGDARHPNSLSQRDFRKWLLKCQRADHEMVVENRHIKIRSIR